MAIVMIAFVVLLMNNVWADEANSVESTEVQENVSDQREKSSLYIHDLSFSDYHGDYNNDSNIYLKSNDFNISDFSFGTAGIKNIDNGKTHLIGFNYDNDKNLFYLNLDYSNSIDLIKGGNYTVTHIYLHSKKPSTTTEWFGVQYDLNSEEEKTDLGRKILRSPMPSEINFKVREIPTIDLFEINGDGVLTDDKDINFSTAIAAHDIDLVTICIQNISTGKKYGPYAIITSSKNASLSADQLGNDVPMGDYKITDVWINPSRKKEGGEGPYAWYGRKTTNNYNYGANNKVPNGAFNYNITFTYKKNAQEVKTIDLSSFNIKQTNAKLNEKVFVDYIIDRPVREAMLIFDNIEGEESMIVTLTDTNELPYFVVPFTTSAGTYKLDYLILKDNEDNETQYRSGDEYEGIKHFDFNCEITIEDEFVGTDLLHLENDKITDTIIQKVKDLDENIMIELDANVDSFVSKSIFEAIQGQNKTLVIKYGDIQWVFNGRDIKEAKEIDARVYVYGTYNDELYGGAVKKGLTLEFANNGTLPGKCLIRVDNNSTVKQYLSNQKSYVYFYNPDTQKMEKVAMQVLLTNNAFYEFYISHNSLYVMTTEEVGDEFISNSGDSKEDLALNGGEKKSVLPGIQLYSENGEMDINTIIKFAIAIVSGAILIIVMAGTVFYKRSEKDKKQ